MLPHFANFSVFFAYMVFWYGLGSKLTPTEYVPGFQLVGIRTEHPQDPPQPKGAVV